MEFQGPFDKNARRALAASVHRAGMLGRETVGTEHLLLGLSASAGGTASKLLADAGAGGWRSLYYTARLTGSRFPMRRPRCISPELRWFCIRRRARRAADRRTSGTCCVR